MLERIDQTRDALAEEGYFVITHDRETPLHWTLALEGGAWLVPRGIPRRESDPRPTQSVDDVVGEVWDYGAYETSIERGSLVVDLDGERLAGRYALRPQGGGAWELQRLDPESLTPFPDRILPMLAHSDHYPREPTNYAFEVKWDGYRAILHNDKNKLVLRSRNLHDITKDYPEISNLRERLGERPVVLDGEIVAFDEQGHASFQALQSRERPPVVFIAFDILYLDGRDTTRLPYEERRALLESLDIAGPEAQISPTIAGDGRAFLALPGIEGIVAKRLGSAYEPGARSAAWIKIKLQKRQEFVVGGWTVGRGSRRGSIGALLVGVYDGDELRYAGSVGTGFDDATLDALAKRMRPMARAANPFVGVIDKADAVFIEPQLVVEVEFTQWTRDGRLRHPSFKGVREDKNPREVVREDV